MKLRDLLNEMMLNPVTIMKCKKLAKEYDLAGQAAHAQGSADAAKRMQEIVDEQKKLGCK